MKPNRKLTGLYKWSFISAGIFSPVLLPSSVTTYIATCSGVVDGNVAGWIGAGIAVTITGAISRIRLNRKWLNARHFDDDDPATADPHLYDKGDSNGDKVRAFMPEERIPDWWSEPYEYLIDPWLRLVAKMDSDTGLVTFTWRPVNYLAKDHAGKCAPIPQGFIISGSAGSALLARHAKISSLINKQSVDDKRFLMFYNSLIRSGVKIINSLPIDPLAEQQRNAATSFNTMGANIQHLTRALKAQVPDEGLCSCTKCKCKENDDPEELPERLKVAGAIKVEISSHEEDD